jgi:hypothetical protein
VYQKSRDDLNWSSGARAGAGAAGTSSRPNPGGSGSGSNTPSGGRQAGAVIFNVNEPKSKRVDQSRGKSSEKIWDVQKSREVRKLEGIIGDLRGLQNSEGKVRTDDDNEPCFCQGQSC